MNCGCCIFTKAPITTKGEQESCSTCRVTPQQKKTRGSGRNSRWKYEEEFRYPGPKPHIKETAILMLADAAEAGTRSLREQTPSKIKGMVHDIIQSRMNDGQLSECDLTLKDITAIENSFLLVLAGTYHGRIEYPGQNKKNND